MLLKKYSNLRCVVVYGHVATWPESSSAGEGLGRRGRQRGYRYIWIWGVGVGVWRMVALRHNEKDPMVGQNGSYAVAAAASGWLGGCAKLDGWGWAATTPLLFQIF